MAEARPRLKWDVQKDGEGLDEARAKIAVDASRVLEAAAEGERRSAEGRRLRSPRRLIACPALRLRHARLGRARELAEPAAERRWVAVG